MQLVIEHHEDLEYDLLTLGPGFDLLDFWRGTLSPRRLLLLIDRLPPATSRYVQARDPDLAAASRWTPEAEAVASLHDVQTVAGHLVNSKTKQPLPPYPRPWDVIATREREAKRSAALLAQRERQLAREAQRKGDA